MADIADVIGLLSDKNKPVNSQLLELAERAAEARDAAAEASAKASMLKSELEDAMKAAKVTEVELRDRTIKYTTRNEVQKTLKAFKAILGEDQGKNLWDNLPKTARTSLTIPAPKAPEPDEV